MAANPDIEVRGITTGRMFHFAGHAFREIGQLNRAAESYWRAGVIPEIGDFSVRSLARAKSCYSEIGETHESDKMHVLEWNARRTLTRQPAKTLLWLWSVTSAYGTSSRRWLVSMGVFLLAFTVIYEALYRIGHLFHSQRWTPLVTATYMAVVTTATVGYGDFVPNNWVAQLTVIVNILAAYVLLAIGSTILGRKVLAR